MANPDRPNSRCLIEAIFTIDTIVHIKLKDFDLWLKNWLESLTSRRKMNSEQLFAEVREANLSYLMLARNLVCQDRADALVRLGLTERAADELVSLSAFQLNRIASSSMLLCSFRGDDERPWSLLTNHNVTRVDHFTKTTFQASVVMAGRYADSIVGAH